MKFFNKIFFFLFIMIFNISNSYAIFTNSKNFERIKLENDGRKLCLKEGSPHTNITLKNLNKSNLMIRLVTVYKQREMPLHTGEIQQINLVNPQCFVQDLRIAAENTISVELNDTSYVECFNTAYWPINVESIFDN